MTRKTLALVAITTLAGCSGEDLAAIYGEGKHQGADAAEQARKQKMAAQLQAMKSDTIERIQTTKRFLLEWSAQIARQYSTRESYQSNANGASFDVPIGAYSGVGTINALVAENYNPDGALVDFGAHPRHASPMRSSGVRGWAFEPVGVMAREWTVVSSGVVSVANHQVSPPIISWITDCNVAFRFEIIGEHGAQGFRKPSEGVNDVCRFSVIDEKVEGASDINSGPAACYRALYRCATDEQRRKSLGRYHSDDGMTTLDLVSEDEARVATPDGAVTSYAHGAADYTRKLVPGLELPYVGPSGDGTWLPVSRVDRNGLTTRYEYGGPRGSLSAIVDAHGRRTEYRRGDDMQLVEVAQPGPGGGELVYGLEWTSGSWVPPWGKLGDAEAYTTLGALRIPDGRRYRFEYEPSGLLSRVTLPDGGVHAYRYGESFPAVSAPVTDYYARLDDLRVEEETVWPQGPDGPSFSLRYETYFEQGATGIDVWQHVIDPDGTVHKTRRAYPAFGGGCSARFSGPIVEEVWSGDRLLERHAYTYAGALRGWADCSDFADQRVVAITHERDGVSWTETFEHQPNPMLPGRVAANVTRHVVAGGGRQRETAREWEDRPEYVARHLLTLPRAEETAGDGYQGGTLVRRVLERVEYGYDERELVPGGLAGLADVGPVRGNVTSTTRFMVPEARAGAVTTAAAFYDTGKVAKEWSAAAVARQDLGDGAARRNTFDERGCGASAVVVARTALPDPGNGAVHATETVTDCNTGLVLASRGVNGAWTCTQYDRIGRVIEVANPGDRLSAIADGVRDRDAARCPTTGSAELGSGGRGPTRWFEYLDTDVAGAARTVIHDKTGGPRGRATTSWRDSLDREIANCIEVDLATVSSGARDALERAADGATPAACIWRTYDHAGRLVSATTSAFQPSVPATPPRPGFDVRTAVTEYDGLGRVTRHATAGGRETTHVYGAAGGRFATTTVPPRGVASTYVTETSVLGHVELVREPSIDCGGDTCISEFRVDALGRVVEAVEPGGATTVTAYDGAGRIIRMIDPDRGELTAVFDENGNRVEERDARGAIAYTYDALDRVTSKVYSTAARPEEARVELSYDGMDPGAPPMVVERAAWQVGAPTGTRNGLVARWARFDARGRATLEVTRLDDGSLWSSETTYGHADGTPADGGALAVARTVPHRAGDEVDTIVYRHDAVGLVRGLDRERGPVTASIVTKMRRNAAGDVVEFAYGNGLATTRAYSSDGDLVSTIARGGDGVVGALEFERDAAGNITAVRDFERCAPGDDGCLPGPLSATYTYDPRNQLVGMSTTGAARAWRYDGMRNLISIEQTGAAPFARTIAYGGTNADGTRRPPHAAGRVDDVGVSAAYDYDAVGNLRATTGRPGGDLAVTWNLDNMPIEVRRADGTLAAAKHFLGESLWKRVEGDLTTYVVKDARIEVRGRELVVRTSYDGYAEGSSASPELRYLHADQLGSTTLVTDDAGRVVYREAAWPFGETRTATGDQPPRARFNGKEVEVSTGLVDFGARVYDPYLGRWWSADDDVRDGLNRYTFVGNNPVTARDPDGHRKKKKAAPASERTTQQQSTANRTAPGPNAQGPIAGFRLRVTLPEPGPFAPNAAPMAGHEYQFTCGSLNGNTLCWTNRPVYVPGAGMVQTATVTFDGKQNVVRLIPVAEPAAPDPGETAVKTGAAAWHIGFTRVRGTGASEGEGATRISIKLRPGFSVSGDVTSDLADRIGVKATAPYTNLVDVSVGENGLEGTVLSRNLSQSLTQDGKLKFPKTKSDWKPNLELYFQIRDSSLIQGLKRYASVCGGVGTYCN